MSANFGTCAPPSGGSGCTATTQTGCTHTTNSGCLDSSSNAAAGTWTAGALINNSNRFNPSFAIGAIGDLGGTNADMWTMNQAKVIENSQDGTQ